MQYREPQDTGSQTEGDLARSSEEEGRFYIHHTSGSHYYLRHPKDPTILVSVPFKVRDIKKGTLHSILRQAKLTREEFLHLLESP